MLLTDVFLFEVMNDASNITYGIDSIGIRSWFTGHLLYPL